MGIAQTVVLYKNLSNDGYKLLQLSEMNLHNSMLNNIELKKPHEVHSRKITTLDELKKDWQDQEKRKFEERIIRRRKCPVCNTEFRSINLKKRHVRNAHSY